MDKKKCKKDIFSDWRSYKCNFFAIKDGYCKIHHPDAEKARQEKADEKYHKKQYQDLSDRAFRFVRTVATLEDIEKMRKALDKRIEEIG